MAHYSEQCLSTDCGHGRAGGEELTGSSLGRGIHSKETRVPPTDVSELVKQVSRRPACNEQEGHATRTLLCTLKFSQGFNRP